MDVKSTVRDVSQRLRDGQADHMFENKTYIMPGHSGQFKSTLLVANPFINILKILHTSVVVILTYVSVSVILALVGEKDANKNEGLILVMPHVCMGKGAFN